MGGFFSDIKEKMRLLGIAIEEETTIKKLNNQIAEIEKQKGSLNEKYDSITNEISEIKNEIMKKEDKIYFLEEELKSKVADEIKLNDAVLSQKQKMQKLVNRYNSLTKEEKTLRKYFGEIQ
jgi:chromosome segregation ATPase